AEMTSAVLVEASVRYANLRDADLSCAELTETDFYMSKLDNANLTEAVLSGARLKRTSMMNCSLYESVLYEAFFDATKLTGASLESAHLGETLFINVDLSQVKDIDLCKHQGPSILDNKTLAKSLNLSPSFLRGCGLTDWQIEEIRLLRPDLSNSEINDIIYHIYDLRANQSIQIAPMFISYSHADKEFVDEIGKLLTEKGVRYWRDIHEMKAGRLEKQVDRAMKLNDLVLIVLSEESVSSDWVEYEAKKARRLEKESGKDVIVPIALDDAWKKCRWPERLRAQIEEYQVLDFSAWKDEAKLKKQFASLLDGIDLFY
ncbi:MAG: toll/interleukin-1 receptor domain-containing protein, partial [Bacteroidota bacterium]